MFKVEHITKDWKEAGSLQAHVNLYGFWDEHCFLTKTGDLGAALRIGGIDYESLDHAGRDYAVKRLEAAFRSLDDKCRLYQILFKHNRPAIPHAEYDSPLVRAAVEQRSAFLQSKADRLYSIEIFWIVMVDGNYAKTGLLHALSQLTKSPRAGMKELKSLFAGKQQRTLLYEQIERDRLLLQQKVQSLSGQLNDLTTVELLGAEKTFRLVRRLVNFRPSKINDAPPVRGTSSRLAGMRLGVGGASRLSPHGRRLSPRPHPERASRRNAALDPQWLARYSGKLPCRYGMAPRRQCEGQEGNRLAPPSSPQLQNQLRIEPSGP